MAKNSVRIRLKAYEHRILDSSAEKIVTAAQAHGAKKIVGPVPLPTEKQVVTILRAVHKYKDSREQFELRTHKRLIEIVGPTAETILRHLEQLKPLLIKYMDVIYSLQCGFVGMFGEFHTSYYRLELDVAFRRELFKNVLELLPQTRWDRPGVTFLNTSAKFDFLILLIRHYTANFSSPFCYTDLALRILDHRTHPLYLPILGLHLPFLKSDLFPEEIDFLLSFLTECSQLCLVFGRQRIKAVLQVLTLCNDDRVVYIDFFLSLGNQDTGRLTPSSVDQCSRDSLHSCDPQVLYIAGHDPVNGNL